MILAAAILVTLSVLLFTLGIRNRDIPAPLPPNPFHYLDERKARIYENLRDLQFEYRVGKLSDEDYQKAKLLLQKELAQVLADVDALKAQLGVKAEAKPAKRVAKPKPDLLVCPHCGAKFAQALKFCGECGKPMAPEAGATA